MDPRVPFPDDTTVEAEQGVLLLWVLDELMFLEPTELVNVFCLSVFGGGKFELGSTLETSDAQEVLTIVIVDMRSLGRVHWYWGTRGSTERWSCPSTRSDRRRWRKHCSKFELFYSGSQKISENKGKFELHAQANWEAAKLAGWSQWNSQERKR
jgi:hypothetical protein